ncbi:hypothetical protein GGI21_001415, partial [Coemansia aciculifera]
MPPKSKAEADSKKKARDDALQFLETLEINDGEEEAPNSQPAEAIVSPTEAANADSGGGGSDEKKDPKSMLKFIDDLTESAKRSASPPANSATEAPTVAEENNSS